MRLSPPITYQRQRPARPGASENRDPAFNAAFSAGVFVPGSNERDRHGLASSEQSSTVPGPTKRRRSEVCPLLQVKRMWKVPGHGPAPGVKGRRRQLRARDLAHRRSVSLTFSSRVQMSASYSSVVQHHLRPHDPLDRRTKKPTGSRRRVVFRVWVLGRNLSRG